MLLKDDERSKLRQTLGQMKHELGAIQQALESAKESRTLYGSYNQGELLGYFVDEYILAFRLGNVTDLSAHLQDVFHLTKRGPR